MNNTEQEYVVDFYNQVHGQFDNTRWKAWPEITNFLKLIDSIESSLGLEVGCGNGKNMLKHLNIIGIDISIEMCKIAYEKTDHDTLLTDATNLTFRDNSFDYALSIAVIHHISTLERRIEFIREIGRVLNIGGKCMISTWIPPQKKQEGDDPDQLITWTFRHNWTESGKDEIVHRYVHIFEMGELEGLVDHIECLRVIRSMYSRSNYYMIVEKI